MNLLIVDDSRLNRIFASSCIEKNAIELDMYFAESGERALEIIDQQKIDVVLLDIVMPGIGGIEALHRIKNLKMKRDIKVIMYSTVSEKELLRKCFEMGASDFIHKPIEEIEFISRLRNTVRQKKLEDDTLEYIEKIETQKSIISDVNIQLIQQEKMAGIGQLAAGVAHEINNPLGFIASNFSVLSEYVDKFYSLYGLFGEEYSSDSELVKKVKDYFKEESFDYIVEDLTDLLEETNVGLTRVTDIVKSLRTFSRIDKMEEFELYDMNLGLRDTLIIANNHIKYAAKVHVEYGELPEIEAIGSQVNQVLLNLILNAVDAIKEKHVDDIGDLYIRTYKENKFVVVSIRDTGIGITDEDYGNLFIPFFTTKPVGVGLGLGLSLSYDIIFNKHKGKIDVKSKYGEGTEFIVYLPCY